MGSVIRLGLPRMAQPYPSCCGLISLQGSVLQRTLPEITNSVRCEGPLCHEQTLVAWYFRWFTHMCRLQTCWTIIINSEGVRDEINLRGVRDQINSKGVRAQLWRNNILCRSRPLWRIKIPHCQARLLPRSLLQALVWLGTQELIGCLLTLPMEALTTGPRKNPPQHQEIFRTPDTLEQSLCYEFIIRAYIVRSAWAFTMCSMWV